MSIAAAALAPILGCASVSSSPAAMNEGPTVTSPVTREAQPVASAAEAASTPPRSGEPIAVVSDAAPAALARIGHAGGASFRATCPNGSVAMLGDAPSPSSAYEDDPRELASADGRHAIAWREKTITITDRATNSSHAIDLGAPVVQVALHPAGSSVFVAGITRSLRIGMGFHLDDTATVRELDLATGAAHHEATADAFSLSSDGKRVLLTGQLEASLRDVKTWRVLRTWKGLSNDALLDPTGRFVFVRTYDKPPSGLGPLETTATFVEDTLTKKRVISLANADGLGAFSPNGSRFAFLPRGFDEADRRAIQIHETEHGALERSLGVDETPSDLAFVSEGVLGTWTGEGVTLQRIGEPSRVRLFGRAQGEGCKLFALSDAGTFQGEPGDALEYRFSEDPPGREAVTSGPDFERQRDVKLLGRLLGIGD